jgi:2-polyprenyl-3-methyl-5-hydroxy-6-metoxy-1,4-benzoquinol methylase
LKNFISLEPTFKHEFWGDYEQGYFNDQSYIVAKCVNCDFIFQSSVLNDSGLKRLYDRWIDPQATLEWRKKLDKVTKSQDYARRLNVILRHFSHFPNINILDWGAGFGDFSAMALSGGTNIDALEFSTERLTYLKKRGIPVIEIKQLQENYYHFINLDQVLEHIVDPVDLLKNIHKFLRDDGILYVGVPKCTNAEQLMCSKTLSQRAFDCLSPLQHINAFTNKTLKRACRKARFRVLFAFNSQPIVILDRKNLLDYIREIFKNFVRPLSYFSLNTNLFMTKYNPRP